NQSHSFLQSCRESSYPYRLYHGKESHLSLTRGLKVATFEFVEYRARESWRHVGNSYHSTVPSKLERRECHRVGARMDRDAIASSFDESEEVQQIVLGIFHSPDDLLLVQQLNNSV